ncbi:hypothetical protein NP569_27675, partial [Vibrio parahaemolyticus]|nr:hypothetical protein [Vibrio parahaemolyticus]
SEVLPSLDSGDRSYMAATQSWGGLPTELGTLGSLRFFVFLFFSVWALVISKQSNSEKSLPDGSPTHSYVN